MRTDVCHLSPYNILQFMKHTRLIPLLFIALGACAPKPPALQMELPSKYEGKTVELVSFLDSVPLATATVAGGRAAFGDTVVGSIPLLAQIVIDGRVRGYYVAEPGAATFADSLSVARGTALNDRFGLLMEQLDSVEALDDMALYLDYVEGQYNANRDNALGPWFGIEWIKFAPLASVDSLLATAPAAMAGSVRAAHYRKFAALREATSPGHRYIDFSGEDSRGRAQRFSSLVRPGRWTLVDFWASWCPYCIKEMPQLQQLYADWHDRGLDIVGVAVRDRSEDTAGAVEKFGVTWPVLYNTGRVPYDIYGFSGIPHHMLIDPEGVIVSRDESAAQIDTRLRSSLGSND